MCATLLLMLLILSYCVSYSLFDFDMLAPSCLFMLGFIAALVNLIANVFVWGDLSSDTVLLIVICANIFVLVGVFVKLSWRTTTNFVTAQHQPTKQTKKLSRIRLRRWLVWAFILFELVTIALSIRSIMNITIPYGGGDTLLHSIRVYNDINKFSEDTIKLPRYIGWMRNLMGAWPYFAIYVFANNWMSEDRRKWDWPLLISFVLSVASSLLTGGRAGLVALVLSCVLIFAFINRQKSGRLYIPLKYIVGIAVLVMCVVAAFPYMAALAGRMSSTPAAQIISIYLGAPTKNLDLFIRSFPVADNFFSSSVAEGPWGAQTFYSLISWAISHLGIPVDVYKLDLPFVSIGSLGMGNVYTCFYMYLRDFGYFGCGVVVAAISFVVHLLYEWHLARPLSEKKHPVVWIRTLLLSQVLVWLVFAFFSNWIIENVGVGILWSIFLWFVYSKCFICTEHNEHAKVDIYAASKRIYRLRADKASA